MHIVLLGPQGSGKGTQARRLAALSGARHVATGDLVRAEIAAGTELGRIVQSYYDAGELAPDDIMVRLVVPHLSAPEGWILDGFPRDRRQAEALDARLKDTGVQIDRVVVLQADDKDLIDRMLGRRQSLATGKIYHVTFDPPPPDDPGPFVQRSDDVLEEILRRLELYHLETEPLQEYYARRGLLSIVDATGTMDEVTDAIVKALDAAGVTVSRVA